MKKSLLTLLFALSINTVFAQYAYQNILDTIEANSTVLAAHHKQMVTRHRKPPRICAVS